MSMRSLEMFTEILGSESGSHFSESMDDRDISREFQRSKCREFKKRIKRTTTFPPPLTSISGTERVRVKSHREGSRLVLRAVSISACSSYFKAERVIGTLRLSWRNDGTSCVEDEREVEQIAEGEYPRTRRCKEKSGSRSKGISNWGQIWVAIS
ncbi:hypothetical protein RND71_018843 [Anisodus tanguticus]|uniref:FAF domain-containing protein n=1 Tax=Anisodus tanguticus TaxID=243964 RepID=A0AAE1S6A9_9SOLA|nr:hypothetical protein RND71_018843 [Anisodus tanguticus]